MGAILPLFKSLGIDYLVIPNIGRNAKPLAAIGGEHIILVDRFCLFIASAKGIRIIRKLDIRTDMPKGWSYDGLADVFSHLPMNVIIEEVVVFCGRFPSLSSPHDERRPAEVEEMILKRANQARLRHFTVVLPRMNCLIRRQRMIERELPELHRKAILKFRCSDECKCDATRVIFIVL